MVLDEGKLIRLISEQVIERLITESFKSNMLRDFFAKHGGVDKRYRQFSLGDIDDDQIGWSREYDNPTDALRDMRMVKQPLRTGKRRPEDMRYLFQIYVAKDGHTMLVGIERDTIETGLHWGGEYAKKVTDRMWNNGWNHKTRNNRYVDDSDTYYYQSHAKDFGLHTSDDFKPRANDNARQMQGMSKEERDEFNKHKVKRLKAYMSRTYPSEWKKYGKPK